MPVIVRFLLLLIVCCTTTQGLQAKFLPQYDLRSLALLSDFILLVEQFEKETEPGGSKVTWCRVQKAYKGKVPVGELFVRPRLDSYQLMVSPLDAAPKWDPEAVLFLVQTRGRKEWDPHAIDILDSGLRLFAAGKAYSFGQRMNPGPYYARRAGRGTAEEAILDTSPGVQLRELDNDLEAAVKQVGKYEAALKIEERALRREGLLAALGPRRPVPVFEDRRWSSYPSSDVFTARVIESLQADHDIATTLEAFSRSPSIHIELKERPNDGTLLGVAADPTRPVHHRVTALRIGASWPSLGPGDYPLLLRLLEDAVPEVRRAAARLCASSLNGTREGEREREERRPLIAGLLAALAREKDPLTRTVIFSAGNEDFYAAVPRPADAPALLFEGCVHEMVAYCVLAFPDRSPEQNPTNSVIAVAVPMGGVRERHSLPGWTQENIDPEKEPLSKEALRRLNRAQRSLFSVDSGFKRIESHYVFFEPPLPSGRYRIHLESRIDSHTGKKTKEIMLRTEPVEVMVTGEE